MNQGMKQGMNKGTPGTEQYLVPVVRMPLSKQQRYGVTVDLMARGISCRRWSLQYRRLLSLANSLGSVGAEAHPAQQVDGRHWVLWTQFTIGRISVRKASVRNSRYLLD